MSRSDAPVLACRAWHAALICALSWLLQLREFYGPLLACVTATASGYQGMVKQHSPDGTRKGLSLAIQANPEGPEAHAYR
jgi:hypothetical protein